MLAGLTTAPGNSCSLSRLFSAKVWKGIFSCVYVSCEIHVYIINTLPFEIQFQKLSFIYNPNILTAVFFPAVVTPPPPHFGKRLKFHEDFHFFIYHHRSEVLLHIHTHTKNEIKK